MAVIRTTIGTASENVDISSVSGVGPWDVTLASAPSSDAVIGDKLTDEADPAKTFLITAINGDTVTVRDAFGESATPSAAGSTQATISRCYSTISAWETALDNEPLYSNGDVAEGAVCERVGAAVDINGGGTVNLSKIILTGHESYRHEGVVGDSSIAGMYSEAQARVYMIRVSTTIATEISWLVVGYNVSGGTYNQNSNINHNVLSGTCTVHHCILWNSGYAAATGIPYGFRSSYGNSSATIVLHNNIIFGIKNPTTGNGIGINTYYCADDAYIYNNTIYDCYSGIRMNAVSGALVVNNIVMGCTTAAFTDNGYSWNASSNNNYTDDASAPGGLSLTEEVVADTFEDYASNDFHLAIASNARGNGSNETGTLTDIEEDIDGGTRPTAPTAWDIGADHYVAAGIDPIPCDANPTAIRIG